MRYLIALLLFVPCFAVWADNGALEINQACASSSEGCFAGDSAGLPVTIVTPGHYVLTGNLAANAGGATIDIEADNAELDLNGFEIAGTAACTVSNTFPISVSCSSDNFAIGIKSGNGISGVTVHNGTVRGIEGDGILLGDRAIVDNVSVYDMPGTGFSVGTGSRITRCHAFRLGSRGINTLDQAMVIGNSIQNVGGDYAMLTFNGAALIKDNNVSFNQQVGIGADNSADRVVGNVVRLNGSWGLKVQYADSAFGDNVFAGNNSSGYDMCGNGSNMGGNFCSGGACTPSACP
ncbi:MAG: right-handed parallel beta-helix repeat-containing protein [Rhodanobacteraceae bacterium]